MTTTESDIWSLAGVYTFPTAPAQMDVISSNAVDFGLAIFSGTASGGNSTSLLDATKDFTAGTAVAPGDCVILDRAGTTPEWGFVTSGTATGLYFSNGFSSTGSASGRSYWVLDKSAFSGTHAIIYEYLDGNYATHKEIVIMKGTSATNTLNTDVFRIQSFRVIATGNLNRASGNLSIRLAGGASTYSYITAGFTRARNTVYTVPAGKTLYVVQFCASYGYTANNAVHYARLYIRANVELATGFNTQSIFYPYAEVITANTSQLVNLQVPIRFPAKTDIKASGIASVAGIATIALRGWQE
jgi:hypothetical protein